MKKPKLSFYQQVIIYLLKYGESSGKVIAMGMRQHISASSALMTYRRMLRADKKRKKILVGRQLLISQQIRRGKSIKTQEALVNLVARGRVLKTAPGVYAPLPNSFSGTCPCCGFKI